MAVSNRLRETDRSTLIASTKFMSKLSNFKILNQSTFLLNYLYRNDSDMYTFIKDKIQKKGWLRKLMDNLTSHR
jgi:hypothetical protein